MTIEEKIIQYQTTRDEALFEELLEQFEPMLRATSKQFSRHQDYEDIIQDQRLLFFECILRFDASKGFKFSTFFWVSAVGNAKRVWAKYSEHNPWTNKEDMPTKISINADKEGFSKIQLVAQPGPDIDIIIDMERIISKLPTEDQRLLKAYFWHGLKLIDIAEVEDISTTALHNRLNKIFYRLRREYESEKRKSERCMGVVSGWKNSPVR